MKDKWATNKSPHVIIPLSGSGWLESYNQHHKTLLHVTEHRCPECYNHILIFQRVREWTTDMLQPHVTIPHAREWTTKELQSTNHVNIPRVRERMTNVLQTTPHVSIPSVREWMINVLQSGRGRQICYNHMSLFHMLGRVNISRVREWMTNELQATPYVTTPRAREWMTNVLETTPHVFFYPTCQGVDDKCATNYPTC